MKNMMKIYKLNMDKLQNSAVTYTAHKVGKVNYS